MTELRLTTTALDAGQRLDRLLSQAAPELSRAALQKAVQLTPASHISTNLTDNTFLRIRQFER